MKTKETNPTRPGSPTPCKQGLSLEAIFELFFQNSSYVSGVSVCIFVALYVRMSVAGANKVEGIMS